MKRRNISSADVGRYAAAVLAILFVIFLSVRSYANMELETIENSVQMKIDEICGRVKLNKELTLEDYKELVSYISSTGISYDVDLSIGRFKENPDTFASVDTDDLLMMLAQIRAASERKSSIRSRDGIECSTHEHNLMACAAHIHSQDCYIGHNHQACGCTFNGTSWSCGIAENDTTPICSKVIVDATWAKDQVIRSGHGDTLARGGAFDNRIYVTYRDGSTGIIEAPVTSFDDVSLGRKTAVMMYNAYYITAFNNTKNTKSFNVNVEIVEDNRVCPICGTSYDIADTGLGYGCPRCSHEIVSVTPVLNDVYGDYGTMKDLSGLHVNVTYADGHIEQVPCSESTFNSSKAGLQNVTVTVKGLASVDYTDNAVNKTVVLNNNEKTCPVRVHLDKYYICPDCNTSYKCDDAGNDPGCPYCSNRCLGIRVVPVTTEYNQGDPLAVTVFAKYRVGEIVLDDFEWTSDYDPWLLGAQNVRIKYDVYSEPLTVTVSDPYLLVCPICGCTFDSRVYSSCPDCASTLVSIEAEAIPAIYSYGEDLMLTVWAVYRSGDKVLLVTGYDVMGYDEYYTAGPQTVTISYDGCVDTVEVKVRDRDELPIDIVVCPNGHFYELNPDGSDPGCPYCSGAKSAEDARGEHYADMIYTTQIVSELYNLGSCKLSEGDTFTITVTQLSDSTAHKLGKLFLTTRINRTYFTSGTVID